MSDAQARRIAAGPRSEINYPAARGRDRPEVGHIAGLPVDSSTGRVTTAIWCSPETTSRCRERFSRVATETDLRARHEGRFSILSEAFCLDRVSFRAPKSSKIGGRACKPDSSGSSLLSISCVESTNAPCQRSQFWQLKQVLCHSYGTVFRLVCYCFPYTAPSPPEQVY